MTGGHCECCDLTRFVPRKSNHYYWLEFRSRTDGYYIHIIRMYNSYRPLDLPSTVTHPILLQIACHMTGCQCICNEILHIAPDSSHLYYWQITRGIRDTWFTLGWVRPYRTGHSFTLFPLYIGCLMIGFTCRHEELVNVRPWVDENNFFYWQTFRYHSDPTLLSHYVRAYSVVRLSCDIRRALS